MAFFSNASTRAKLVAGFGLMIALLAGVSALTYHATTKMEASQRALFEIPDDVTYLNCASMSPQLRAVTEAGLAGVRSKTAPWTLTSRDWFDGANRK